MGIYLNMNGTNTIFFNNRNQIQNFSSSMKMSKQENDRLVEMGLFTMVGSSEWTSLKIFIPKNMVELK